MSRTPRQGRGWSVRCRIRHKDGSYVWVGRATRSRDARSHKHRPLPPPPPTKNTKTITGESSRPSCAQLERREGVGVGRGCWDGEGVRALTPRPALAGQDQRLTHRQGAGVGARMCNGELGRVRTRSPVLQQHDCAALDKPHTLNLSPALAPSPVNPCTSHACAQGEVAPHHAGGLPC